MQYKDILITGASGKLGRALIPLLSNNHDILTPSHSELDITNRENVRDYLTNHKPDAIIHCAAISSVIKSEKDPSTAINVNILGTSNLVDKLIDSPIRFIYISTDYVYSGEKGPYSEKDQTIPSTIYGWTKLGGERFARLMPNHCVIRTSFFDPNNIPFDDAPEDSFCSKITLSEIARDISFILENSFIGTINIGRERESLYNIYKEHKPSIVRTSIKDLSNRSQYNRALDSSLNISQWNNLIKS